MTMIFSDRGDFGESGAFFSIMEPSEIILKIPFLFIKAMLGLHVHLRCVGSRSVWEVHVLHRVALSLGNILGTCNRTQCTKQNSPQPASKFAALSAPAQVIFRRCFNLTSSTSGLYQKTACFCMPKCRSLCAQLITPFDKWRFPKMGVYAIIQSK